jgi:dihydrofolate synthase/folylpolyglutamate synthase
MLADKDVAAVLGQLRDGFDGWWAASTEGPRGLSDAALADVAARAGINMRLGGRVTDALRSAAAAASPGDRIVVFGSFHTVGPALSCV